MNPPRFVLAGNRLTCALAACVWVTTTLPWAVPKLTVQDAAIGSRTLVLTVDEPVTLSDLRGIQVDGYDMDQATWIKEADSLVLSPLLVDLTAQGAPRVREMIPSQNSLILEAPLFFEPKSGMILSDTAFGGVLCRVLQAIVDGPTLGVTRRWVVVYEPASVEDVFISADISFRSTMDMSLALQDSSESNDVLGIWPDSTLASAHFDMSWKEARIRLQPEIFGHLNLQGGQVRTFDVGLQGLAEATGKFHLKLKGQGAFAWDRPIRFQPSVSIPIGHGLQLQAKHQPIISLRAEANDSVLVGGTQFRIQQEMKSQFQTLGLGQPSGDAKLAYEATSTDSGQGTGTIHFQVRSLIAVSMGASDAHRISILNQATLTQSSLELAEPEGMSEPSNGALSPVSQVIDTRPNWAVTSPIAIPRSPAPMSWNGRTTEISAPNPYFNGQSKNGIWSLANAFRAPTHYSQRQLKLGASLSIDQRLDSTALPRGWLLYSREIPLLAPPKTISAQVQKSDGNRFQMICQASPKADWFSIQGQLPNGVWVTVMDRIPQGRIKLPDFGGTPPLRVRVIAGNAFGVSLPFPIEGLILPLPNRPPLTPYAYLPENATITDTALRLTWRSEDPDTGARLTYDLHLDTQNPPMNLVARGLMDSTFNAMVLTPNTTYFWRVVVRDGMDSSLGPVASFITRKPKAADGVPVPMHESTGNPWVFLDKGAFSREDQQIIHLEPFFLQKYEVTQGEYRRVMGENPSFHVQDSLPVERVTWEEAGAYCQAVGGRLPTEAEWEFAARGGKNNPAWILVQASEFAWYRGNSDGHTQKVGQLKPNGFGLHDMAGNVFEWVSDWYGPYESKVVENPTGPATGTAKVIRGASWYSEAPNLSPSVRFSNRPGFRNYKVGFRCAENVTTASTTTPAKSLAGP